MNGLGQSIAFCRSKYTAQDTSKNGAKAYKTLYVIIQEWLCNGDFAIFNKGDDLLEAIVSNDMHKYRLAQSELQDLLSWLKKATLALVEISEEDDNDAVRS
jgi:CRISPR type III-B/RAMP module-associated protein Cmr5